jgi:hypothetical protein
MIKRWNYIEHFRPVQVKMISLDRYGQDQLYRHIPDPLRSSSRKDYVAQKTVISLRMLPDTISVTSDSNQSAGID